jgi:hypothetical protein
MNPIAHPLPAARQHMRLPLRLSTLLAASLCLSAGLAQAAPDKVRSVADIEAAYRTERLACTAGRTGQDPATCLREAGAAHQQALKQGLDGGQSQQQMDRNALTRCEAVASADRDACERLARGEGQRSGSVAGGGVLMEITTRSAAPARAPQAASAASAASAAATAKAASAAASAASAAPVR